MISRTFVRRFTRNYFENGDIAEVGFDEQKGDIVEILDFYGAADYMDGDRYAVVLSKTTGRYYSIDESKLIECEQTKISKKEIIEL